MFIVIEFTMVKLQNTNNVRVYGWTNGKENVYVCIYTNILWHTVYMHMKCIYM